MVRLARWSVYQGDLNIVILKRASQKVVFSARWSDYQGGHISRFHCIFFLIFLQFFVNTCFCEYQSVLLSGLFSFRGLSNTYDTLMIISVSAAVNVIEL